LGGDRWATEFHVWTFEWDSTKIDLSLDGTLINHYVLANADGTGPNGTNPFRHPGYMIVNQAIGGSSGGDWTNTAFPINFRVDWVRVHVWTNATSYNLTVNGGAGSGPYVAGTKASITAKMPPAAGQVFDTWVINTGNPVIDNLNATSATMTMPAADVTVTATYRTGGTSVAPGRARCPAIKGISIDNQTVIYDINGKKITIANKGPSRLPAGVYIVAQKSRAPDVSVIQR
jgi:hypothetical protein